jgi:hypothetical protein
MSKPTALFGELGVEHDPAEAECAVVLVDAAGEFEASVVPGRILRNPSASSEVSQALR